MKKQVLFSSMLLAGTLAFGQAEYAHQYFFTAGGQFLAAGNTVAVGYVKNNNAEYIDYIKGDFSNAVNVFYNESLQRYEGTAHIGRASNKDLLVRYNLDTYRVIDSTSSAGVKAIARNVDKIVVAKSYGSTGEKVDLLDPSTLAVVASFPEIKNNCQDVKILGDLAYVSHSDSVGRISVINLKTNAYVTTYDLGKRARGISNLIATNGPGNSALLYFSGGVDSIYQFVNAFVYSKKDLNVLAVTESNVFGLKVTSPNLTTVALDKITTLSTEDQGIKNTGDFDYGIYAQYDTVNNEYLVLKPSYSATSWLLNFKAGEEADSLALKTSVTAITIDYRPTITTSLFTSHTAMASFKAYPNPCKDFLTVQTSATTYRSAQISSLDGRLVESFDLSGMGEYKIPTSNYEKGIYMLSIKGDKGMETIKFIKE